MISKRKYLLVSLILYCYIAFSQHPHSHGGGALYWGLIGGLGALISYLLYLAIGFLWNLIRRIKVRSIKSKIRDFAQLFFPKKRITDEEINEDISDETKTDDKGINHLSVKKSEQPSFFCKYCGKAIEQNITYCPHCGNKINGTIGLHIFRFKLPKRTTIQIIVRFFLKYLLFLALLFGVAAALCAITGSNHLWGLWGYVLPPIICYLLYKLIIFAYTPSFSKRKAIRIVLTIVALSVMGLEVILDLKENKPEEIKVYDSFNNTYIPKAKLDSVLQIISTNLNSKNDSIKIECAYLVLFKEPKWGVEGISDEFISSKLEDYQISSFKYIVSMAYSGNPRCQFILGVLYERGETLFNCVNINAEKSTYWYNEAAQQGYTKAYNNLGNAYKKGRGVKQDIRKAVEYFRMGAEAGNDYAQWNYGNLFIEGVSIKVGSHKVVRSTKDYYMGSNDNVISKTYGNYGECTTKYYDYVDDYEILVPKDIEQAKYWWKKSAAQGNKGAIEQLQKIYE